MQRFGILIVLIILLVGCTASGQSVPYSDTPDFYLTRGQDRTSALSSNLGNDALIAGISITKPFGFHDPGNGMLVGLDVDIAETIAGCLGKELRWVEMPFGTLIPSLRDDKLDLVIAAMHITPERQQLVNFAGSYGQTGLVMVIRSESEAKIKSIEDLEGMRLGVKIGATGAVLADEWVAQGINVEVHPYKETIDSLLDLEVGRLDVVLNDYLNTLAYIREDGSALTIVQTSNGEVNFLSRTNLGIAVRKGDTELLEQVRTCLDDLRQRGTLDRLYEKWLGEKP